jgi:predicted NUDIX family NTP pyrophosphohydrolase
MPKHSAGLLLYRRRASSCEVLLVHPGGPFWKKKDHGAWSIPKGLVEEGEEPLATAKREFAEETGLVPQGQFDPLGSFRQSGGKIVHAWAVEGDFDPNDLKCNTFTLEWPPRSGRMQEFPEVDRAAWFSLQEASAMIIVGQRPMLRVLADHLR